VTVKTLIILEMTSISIFKKSLKRIYGKKKKTAAVVARNLS